MPGGHFDSEQFVRAAGILGDLLNDPPGFDRAETAGVDRKVSAFFRKLLLSSSPSTRTSSRPSR